FVASCRTFADRIGEFGARVVWVACSGSSAPAVAIDGELTVDSPTANGFIGSNLELVLRSNGIDRFALAGWPLEIAVHSTMRRANDLGYECLLLEDLCVPMDEKLQRSSISQILMSGGIFGAVGLSGDLADAMAQSHPTQSAATTGQGAESQ
ncbi:MAG: cysteine hydrolase family protein, partial [Solirubrobacterales bacterium]